MNPATQKAFEKLKRRLEDKILAAGSVEEPTSRELLMLEVLAEVRAAAAL